MKVGLLALLVSLGLAICLPLAATAGEVDTDGDTIPDSTDNCPTTANAGQADGDSDSLGDVCDNCSALASIVNAVNDCDIDSDGYGGPCDPDMNNDGNTQVTDFGVWQLNFGMPATPSQPSDLNCDGNTQVTDFGIWQMNFGMPPGPSGLSCALQGAGVPQAPPCACVGNGPDSGC